MGNQLQPEGIREFVINHELVTRSEVENSIKNDDTSLLETIVSEEENKLDLEISETIKRVMSKSELEILFKNYVLTLTSQPNLAKNQKLMSIEDYFNTNFEDIIVLENWTFRNEFSVIQVYEEKIVINHSWESPSYESPSWYLLRNLGLNCGYIRFINLTNLELTIISDYEEKVKMKSGLSLKNLSKDDEYKMTVKRIVFQISSLGSRIVSSNSGEFKVKVVLKKIDEYQLLRVLNLENGTTWRISEERIGVIFTTKDFREILKL